MDLVSKLVGNWQRKAKNFPVGKVLREKYSPNLKGEKLENWGNDPLL